MHRLLSLVLMIAMPVSAEAWGAKGHLLINRLAIDVAAASLPEFMNASRDQIIYNGYEPDRWREEAGTPMNTAQAPDHFFDSELWGSILTIENDRYSFMEKVAAKKLPLEKIGYLPYSIVETYGRLVNAFRQWRKATTAAGRESARANAVFYAGVLGHYAGDASQPMHLSIHYNGWADDTPNPKHYSKDRRLHSRYETIYVTRAIEIATVRPKVRPPQRISGIFSSVKAHLEHSLSELEPVYQLEMAGEFNPDAPKPKGTEFIANQIGRAATMLSNLWYTAWLASGEPLPAPPRR